MIPCHAEYDGGASYSPHRDSVPDDDDDDDDDDAGAACSGSDSNNKANSWCNPRVCTAILYLNNWVPSAGGQLRCFVGADGTDDVGSTCTNPRDVPPIGGRIVVFKSQELLHAVLPSRKPRKALTVWFVSPSV